MKKPMYELIENAVILITGAIGITAFVIAMGFLNAYNYIPCIACLIICCPFMAISFGTWNIQEDRKRRWRM